jgi:glycosyltransferase involved in cell wall biosynthesis
VKILLVHNSYQQPGGEDVVFNLERQMLERSGHDVSVYYRSNFELEKYGKLTAAKNVVWSTDTQKEILRLLEAERPSVVHIHNTFAVISPSIYWACREAGVPVVQTLHNFRLQCLGATFFRDGKVCTDCLGKNPWRGVAHACYQGSRANSAALAAMLTVHRALGTFQSKVDRYVALTEFGRRIVVEAGLPADKISVKPNFVHPDPGMGAEAKSIGDYALFVGRLSPEKGVATVIEAWKRLKLPIPLRILGGGPERESLEAAASGVPCISFEGPRPREEVIAAMRGARFLLFPSLWFETFGLTVTEAFACGTPALCSKLGVMLEIVEDRRTGLHFEAGNPDDLAAKAEWAWEHPEEMRRMGIEARREFEQRYTAEVNYPILMDIYEQALCRQ